MTFTQFRGRRKGAKVLMLPILPPLRTILDSSRLGRETWLQTSFGKPYQVAGFGNAFSEWCREAGLPQCTSHGLRKIGAVRAAESGASERELMAMLGWRTPTWRAFTLGRLRKKDWRQVGPRS